jgi:hypothetical protein
MLLSNFPDDAAPQPKCLTLLRMCFDEPVHVACRRFMENHALQSM